MGVIGGGLLVAVAAALWIAYLMPIWFRRRQYLATERNAVRLQQTLRILAETAETPEPVLIEANARQIALHQRALREQERTARLEAQTTERLAIAERRVAEAAAEAAADVVAHTPIAHASRTEPIEVVAPDAAAGRSKQAAPAGSSPIASRRMLRRRRALCSLLLLVGLLTAAGGLVGLVFGASPLVAVAGGALVALAFTALASLARVRTTAPVAAPVARPVVEAFEPVELAADDERHEGWTPRPLPKPLTLSRGTIAATAMASIEAAAELQRVAQEAERARRIEELATPVPTIAPAAQTPQAAPAKVAPEPASPYAGMGVVGEPQRRFGDLDAVLQRRRKAG
ncbi:hypothetical protein [Agromyces sp. Leaf222]|uniref:hypothetical protein n=1 Tax=Agromyces sp. Leaf222 TaxID=1735688 RepID=UPI000701C53C|nr:hypothetical protein [Agromyces sp. Leaf222]KQM82918.1 hypothetical protein ASE68_06340 [Agromyces sp. Leaf222]